LKLLFGIIASSSFSVYHEFVIFLVSTFSAEALPNQLYQWRDQALQALPSLFSDQSAHEQAAKDAAHERQVQRLYAQIGKLTAQLEWLKKKWACLIQMKGASMSRDDE
jgi:hypothetical protein